MYTSIALNTSHTSLTIPKDSVLLNVVEYFGQPRLTVKLGDEDFVEFNLTSVPDGTTIEGTYVGSYVFGGTLYHLIKVS